MPQKADDADLYSSESRSDVPSLEDGKRQDAASTYFDPHATTNHLSGNLPHWRQEGTTYFVTFRLGDSMPREKLDQWIDERDAWQKANPQPHTPKQRAEYAERFPERFESWLDAGYGSCILNVPEARMIVQNALRHFDGERYHLDEFVVMPNHVHVLLTPLAPHTLSQILHSWKSFTAKEILKVEAASRRLNEMSKRRDVASTTVWQKESFDHIVRNPANLDKFRQYIRDNPKRGSGVPPLSLPGKRRDAASTYFDPPPALKTPLTGPMSGLAKVPSEPPSAGGTLTGLTPRRRRCRTSPHAF